MKFKIAYAALVCANTAFGSNFSKSLMNLKDHDVAKALEEQSQVLGHRASVDSSWGDPVLKVAAKNFPSESFSFDESPMTGIEISVSQKIPLTGHRSFQKSTSEAMANAILLEKEDTVRRLRLRAWKIATQWTAKEKEIQALEDSLTWLTKKIEVTQNLYANGQSSQQAILEIQILKSDVQSTIKRNKHEKKKLEEDLRYLFGTNFKIEETEITWSTFSEQTAKYDRSHPKEEALYLKVQAKHLAKRAKDLNRIPDLTLGAGYTFRSDLDDRGDFASLSIAIPLPVSSKRSSGYNAAASSAASTSLAYENYKKERHAKIARESIQIESINAERKIIANQTLKFAETSREIVSKSYGLGNASYVELLAAELSLQNVRLKDIKLWAELQMTISTLQYLKGDRLW